MCSDLYSRKPVYWKGRRAHTKLWHSPSFTDKFIDYSSWITNLLLDVLMCNIARQNTAQLAKVYGDTTHQYTLLVLIWAYFWKATFLSLSKRRSTKGLHKLVQIMFWNRVFDLGQVPNFGQVINRVEKIANFGHKQDMGFEKRAAHPAQYFWEWLPWLTRSLGSSRNLPPTRGAKKIAWQRGGERLRDKSQKRLRIFNNYPAKSRGISSDT